MQKSAISWTTETWNPVSGCSKVSDGCKFCYAMTLSLKRGWTEKPWTIQNEDENVVMKPHKLHEPYKIKEPSRVFVNSMSDLHHRTFPDWYRAAVWIVMLDLPQHVFQVLTKRSESLAEWHQRFLWALESPEFDEFRQSVKDKRVKAALYKEWTTPWADHIWQGVSVEDGRVLKRLDDLRACGAKVKFVSAEPLLGAWGNADVTGLDWIIVGGESGDHMELDSDRWMKMEWAREIRDLCVAAGAAYFYKQDSGKRTELRPWLIEEDGSKWRWHQFPGDLTPPIALDDKGEPLVQPEPEPDPEPPAPTPESSADTPDSDDVLPPNRQQMKQDVVDAETRLGAFGTLPEASKESLKQVKAGSTVYAKEDIHSGGIRIVPLGSKGVVESRGRYGLNVRFNTHEHIILCSWDMIAIEPIEYKDTPGYQADLASIEGWRRGGINDAAIEALSAATPASPPKPALRSLKPGDAIWIDPHTPGEQPLTGVYLHPDKKWEGVVIVELNYPDGKKQIGIHSSGVHTGSPPEPVSDKLIVGCNVRHRDLGTLGILRRVEGKLGYVQFYGPEGLIIVTDSEGQPLLVEVPLHRLAPTDDVWQKDPPLPPQKWVQAPNAEEADRRLAELNQYVHNVNFEALRLDQEWDANIPRKRAQGVEHFNDPAMGDVLLGKLMQPETDAFVELASGGTIKSVEELQKLDVITGDPVASEVQAQILHNTVDKTPDNFATKPADTPPSVERTELPDKTSDNLPAIPFGEGERLIVTRSAAALDLADFMAYEYIKPGTRVWYAGTVQRDYMTYAVCTLNLNNNELESKQFAIGLSVLVPEPQQGDVLRFADKWGDDVEISEYRCDRIPIGAAAGYWSHREPGQSTWSSLGNLEMRQRLDMGLHPDPEHAVPLPKEVSLSSHTITIHTAQMGVTDPDMLDTTVKSASTPEGKALAPTWEMVQRMTQDQYKPAYFRLIRNRYVIDPTPFMNILNRDRVVLKCYCSSAEGTFCHRHLAVELLKSIGESVGIKVIEGGEIVRGKKLPEAQPAPAREMPQEITTGQLSLFDLMGTS